MPIDPQRTRAVAALRFRALGDETRLRLLELLTAGERTVADLMEATALGQSLVSHHLRTLRGAGLVTTRRDGRWIFYGTNQPALASAKLVLYELEPLKSEPR
ncbi:MAG: arsR [Gemmatimonadetes bacterium]|nr:arsR [Gemmatimonadota bacterium]